jgi:hypothetical protein
MTPSIEYHGVRYQSTFIQRTISKKSFRNSEVKFFNLICLIPLNQLAFSKTDCKGMLRVLKNKHSTKIFFRLFLMFYGSFGYDRAQLTPTLLEHSRLSPENQCIAKVQMEFHFLKSLLKGFSIHLLRCKPE